MSLLPFFAGAALALAAASLAPETPAQAKALTPGTLPAQWSAGNDCVNEPEFQIHAYNEDLFILRQSKCKTAEAPFLYLLMGTERALLLDTGATTNSSVRSVVGRLVTRWSAAQGLPTVPLVVAHTHSHGDHTAGDAQFVGDPSVQAVVGTSLSAVQQFFGFQNWPIDQPTFDLGGGRVLDVLAIPGHQAASLAFYDRDTGLLLTGDSVYPGHLFIPQPADFGTFKESTKRLVDFAAANEVSHVLGTHIEYSDTPFQPYPWATSVHPAERKLELTPDVLRRIYVGASQMGATAQCQIFSDFVIHPLFACGSNWNG